MVEYTHHYEVPAGMEAEKALRHEVRRVYDLLNSTLVFGEGVVPVAKETSLRMSAVDGNPLKELRTLVDNASGENYGTVLLSVSGRSDPLGEIKVTCNAKGICVGITEEAIQNVLKLA